MKSKLETDDGKRCYRRRKQTVEPLFGIVKTPTGFIRFHLRGVRNVAAKWTLAALTYNCQRLALL